MSRRTNRNDVTVARYKMFARAIRAAALVLVALIGAGAAGTVLSSVYLEDVTVVIAPGGSVTIAPVTG